MQSANYVNLKIDFILSIAACQVFLDKTGCTRSGLHS